MIEGLNVRCVIGGLDVLASPRIVLTSRRRSLVSRAAVDVPDPDGRARAALAIGQPVDVRFGFRGATGLAQRWQGKLDGIAQSGPDTLRLQAAGPETALLSAIVTETYCAEPAAAIARRLLQATGLPVGSIAVPAATLPHAVFAAVSVARAIRQLAYSLTALGHDLSAHALWLGASGLCWSDAGEPGPVYGVAAGENLIDHAPPACPGAMGRIAATLIPGLSHSRSIRLRDARRGLNATVQALEVEHVITPGGNATTILYGGNHGWL